MKTPFPKKVQWIAEDAEGARFYFYHGLGWIDAATGLIVQFDLATGCGHQPGDATHVRVHNGYVSFLKSTAEALLQWAAEDDEWVTVEGEGVDTIPGQVVRISDGATGIGDRRLVLPEGATHILISNGGVVAAKQYLTEDAFQVFVNDGWQTPYNRKDFTGTFVWLPNTESATAIHTGRLISFMGPGDKAVPADAEGFHTFSGSRVNVWADDYIEVQLSLVHNRHPDVARTLFGRAQSFDWGNSSLRGACYRLSTPRPNNEHRLNPGNLPNCPPGTLVQVMRNGEAWVGASPYDFIDWNDSTITAWRYA